MNVNANISQETAWIAWDMKQRPINSLVAQYIETFGNVTDTAWVCRKILESATGEHVAPGLDTSNFHRIFVGYHEMCARLAVPTEACWTCKGEQEVVEYETATGFAGGAVYITTLACGHASIDESDDVRAAY